MIGVEGWGRHLGNGSRAAAQAVHALTHPSNLASPNGLIVVQTLLGPSYAAAAARGAGLTRVGSYRVPSRSIA